MKQAEQQSKTRTPFRDWPRKKKAACLAGGIAALLLVVGAVLTGVLVPLSRRTPAAAPSFTYSQYFYAVDAEGDGLLALPTDWITAGTLASFPAPSNNYPDNVEVKNGVVRLLSMPTLPSGDSLTSFQVILEYSYGGRKAATINVLFLKGVKHVTTLPQLAALDGGTDVAILDADLDCGGTGLRISHFGGRLYANHHTLSGFLMDSRIGLGGLFGVLEGGSIYGLNLSLAPNSAFYGADLQLGCLVDRAVDRGSMAAHIGFCRVQGELMVVPQGGVNAIGALVGSIQRAARNVYPDVSAVECSSSDLTLDVRNGAGRLYVGGLIGEAQNVRLNALTFSGDLRVTLAGDRLGGFCYVGGVAGSVSFAYAGAPRVTVLDVCSDLNTTGNVTVQVSHTSVGNDVFAGGVCGAVDDIQLLGCHLSGALDVTSEGVPLLVGGVVGGLENSYADSDLKLSVSDSGVAEGGSVRVQSEGVIRAGGIAGQQSGCLVSEQYLGNTPLLPQIQGSHTENKIGEIYGRSV